MEHQQLRRVRSACSSCSILRLIISPAFFPNSTSTYLARPAVTKAPTETCSTNCTYPQIDMYHVYWVQMFITATYTAETVVLVVNKKNNSTRTSTISNPEIDFGKIATPTNLNSDGTVTASVVDNDGSTRIVYVLDRQTDMKHRLPYAYTSQVSTLQPFSKITPQTYPGRGLSLQPSTGFQRVRQLPQAQ